jgi:hypothetical protein
MASVDNLPNFLNENMPSNPDIANAKNPLPGMYHEAQKAYELVRIAYSMGKSKEGMVAQAAPEGKLPTGMGRSNTV